MNPRELVGRTLGHKFLLEAMIGRGGFGAVYRASQLPLGRMVAVKVNLHLRHGALRTRFVREARVLSELRHPGCLTRHANGRYVVNVKARLEALTGRQTATNEWLQGTTRSRPIELK